MYKDHLFDLSSSSQGHKHLFAFDPLTKHITFLMIAFGLLPRHENSQKPCKKPLKTFNS